MKTCGNAINEGSLRARPHGCADDSETASSRWPPPSASTGRSGGEAQPAVGGDGAAGLVLDPSSWTASEFRYMGLNRDALFADLIRSGLIADPGAHLPPAEPPFIQAVEVTDEYLNDAVRLLQQQHGEGRWGTRALTIMRLSDGRGQLSFKAHLRSSSV